MRVLALDSTTRAGSVALIVDTAEGPQIDERSGDASRPHAERLPAEVLALLAARQIGLSEIDLFVVASGPGLFTGLRIGIATMQGFALVRGRPLLGVSALDAIGHLASRGQPRGVCVGAWMNAHRQEVFSALFRVGDAPVFDPARLEVREDASVGAPESTLRRWLRRHGAPAAIAGDGTDLYRDLIARELSMAAVIDPSPLAAALGLLGLERYRRGERGTAAGVQPLYVRRPDAELAREHALAHRAAHVDQSN
jgi:tRNA threonylcarbamoyladenosine biosynthesis protein TsaB